MVLVAQVRALENELAMNGQNNANVEELKGKLSVHEAANEELTEAL